jgi:hypothetical protein
VAQDFWASSGYHDLTRTAEGWLAPGDGWLRRFLAREELTPPDDAGPREKAMHARLLDKPRLRVGAAEVAAVEDEDARGNWRHWLAFRDRVLAAGTLEACYAEIFRAGAVDMPPLFIDLLAQSIVRHLLEGSEDPWLARAGEMLFRRQRVSVEGGQVLAADATSIEMYAESGGFGDLGRLIKQQNTPLAQVKLDVLNHENAAVYFLRDEMHSFLLDLTPGREGLDALARVLERWVAHFTGARVAITPAGRVDDERWRWHVGLDTESTAMLNALYAGEALDDARRARLLSLFRLEFADPGDMLADVAGSPVYLGLAVREDRTLKLKPQNLLVGLPLRAGD